MATETKQNTTRNTKRVIRAEQKQMMQAEQAKRAKEAAERTASSQVPVQPKRPAQSVPKDKTAGAEQFAQKEKTAQPKQPEQRENAVRPKRPMQGKPPAQPNGTEWPVQMSRPTRSGDAGQPMQRKPSAQPKRPVSQVHPKQSARSGQPAQSKRPEPSAPPRQSVRLGTAGQPMQTESSAPPQSRTEQQKAGVQRKQMPPKQKTVGAASGVHRNTKRKRRKRYVWHPPKWLIALLIVLAVGIIALVVFFATHGVELETEVNQLYLDPNTKARTGEPLKDVQHIMIHSSNHPGMSAKSNRDAYNRKKSKYSMHFEIGLNGEIVQCIPLEEQASAVKERNPDTINIELCHPDRSGKINSGTYASLVELTAELCRVYDLEKEAIVRHYDSDPGRKCPGYFVQYPEAWEKVKAEIQEAV